jgi:copper chaperone
MFELKVNDMTCSHCVATVTKTLKAADPTATVDIDLASKRVRVERRQPLDELTAALQRAGYRATL